MKKAIALVFLLIFTGLGFYYIFAEDYCPVHNSLPGPALSHAHRQPPSVCLCFWNALFSPGSCDFFFFQDVMRFAASLSILEPAKPFDSDIAHPPEFLPA